MTKPTFSQKTHTEERRRKNNPPKEPHSPLYHPLSLILTPTAITGLLSTSHFSPNLRSNHPDLQIPDPPIQMVRPTGLSAAAPQPSPSNSTAVPCSPQICAPPYCLQACAAAANTYYFLPPPAPLSDSSSGKISPLMITLITLLAAAALLLAYYTFASKFCKRRRFRRSGSLADESRQLQARINQLILQDATTSSSQLAAVNSDGGLNDHFIKSITVFRFKRGDGLVESTECAVCLTEFNEGESLRLMPNCQHAFHPPCIDTWLRTHASCPICRSSMVGAPPPAPPPPVVSRMRVERGGDVVMVVDAGGRGCVRVVGGEGDSGRRQVAPEPAEGEEVGEKGRSNN